MERDSSLLSDVYMTFMSLLSNEVYKKDAAIMSCIENRWNFIDTESMGFSYFLDPRNLGRNDMVNRSARKLHFKNVP
jgi:hypothetical protein